MNLLTKTMDKLLDTIDSPSDLKKIPQEKLSHLIQEIRKEIIENVSHSGGHLASSLGAVELVVALHYVLDAPRDVIIWDVGHQAYAHKLLTGRREKFKTLRQLDGISGFPNKDESVFDTFTTGHGSTSISTALGMASARDLRGGKEKIVAVIGDASLGGGMAFEALNHAGHIKKNLIIILNDNEMSISPSVGALSKYLNRIITNPIYNRIRHDVENLLKGIPRFGFRALKAARRLEEGLKNLLVPGIFFEELGFRYFGPIDGHDINLIITTLRNVMNIPEPIILHFITKKGKGYPFAEKLPEKFHGVGSFDIATGKKIDKMREVQLPPREILTHAKRFASKLIELAKDDPKIIAVTAAMPEGTGLEAFAKKFPERFFDVGMAEQHAVAFSAGLARAGFKPVVAIYSSFLQRAYDQIFHDVCLQGLDVVFAIDRAGLVGEDGPTHHGAFDIAYLRHLPGIVVMAPKDEEELAQMLEFALTHNGPVALRYPRGSKFVVSSEILETLPLNSKIRLGEAEVLREGRQLAIIALGSMVYPSIEAAQILSQEGLDVGVVNARFVKPLDTEVIKKLTSQIKRLLIVEEGTALGGFGAAVLEFIESENLSDIHVKILGLPDKFVEHGARNLLLARYGLNASGIAEAARKLYAKDKDKSLKM